MDFIDMQAVEDGMLQAVGTLPLTPEQASSLRSAIMLLSEGDGVGQFVMPEPPIADRDRDGHRRVREDDRQAFVGMYS